MPAPIVFRTSCGGFRLERDGDVTRLPRHWFALRSGGTGRRYGADLELRRTLSGRFRLIRDGRLAWRSAGRYRGDGGEVAFGPHAFAFASFRRGVFLTNLDRPERLVLPGRGLFPIDFTRRGELLVAGRSTISVVARDGKTLRRFPMRRNAGFVFDGPTETLFFVTPDGALARTYGTRLRRLRPLRGIDGFLTAERGDLLFFEASHDVAITRRDGTVLARARWRGGGLDAGVNASRDGRRFAFRVSTARPGSRAAAATVYLLRAGAVRARPLFRHRLGPSGCGSGASLSWHGSHLLYSSTDGTLAVLDTRAPRRLSLRGLARALPELDPGERADAYWESDLD